jgi:hypothetical protein
MKKVFLFISIQLFFGTFFAHNFALADWEPFPTEQISYFTLKDHLTDKCFFPDKRLNDYTVSYRFDSIRNEPNGARTFYSARLKNYNIYKNCDLAIINGISNYYGYYNLRVDSISMRNDTIFYFDNSYTETPKKKFKEFFIPIYMKAFDLIEQEAFFLKDKGISYEQIFPGLYDSVRTYGIKQKSGEQKIIELKLSKHYGIIKFPPFVNLLCDIYDEKLIFKLSGVNAKNREKHGLNPELFDPDEFFTLKVGDEKYWIMEEIMGQYSSWFIKNKITSIQRNEDSIVIYKSNTVYDNNTKKYEYYNSSEKYFFSELLRLKEKNDQEIFVTNRQSFGDEGRMLIETGGGLLFFGRPLIQSTKSSTMLEFNGQMVDPACEISHVTDIYWFKVFSPVVGLSHIYSHGFSGSYTELVGYTKDGVLYGECPQPLAVDDTEIDLSISVSPNPATDYITIDLSFQHMQESEIEIFDIFGNEIHPPRLASQATPQEGNLRIDISSLNAGVYFVRIGSEKPVKFIKI